MDDTPAAMDKHLDVLKFRANGGLLVGASSLTGRYWLGSLWYYTSPDTAPDVEKCSAGVQLEAGLQDADWVDDDRVLLALDTGGVALWQLQDDCKTFTMLQSACEHDDITSSVSTNADASSFVSASHDKGIKVWNTDLISLHTYRGHFDKVLDVQFHPTESAVFLSCSQDGNTVLWDTRKSKPASRLGNSTCGFPPSCLAWQPSAPKMFGIGFEGGQVAVQDLRMVVEKTIYSHPHRRLVTSLSFSPDRPSVVASTSEDSVVAVISLDAQDSTAPLLYRSNAHSDAVSASVWCNMNLLLSCGWDGQVIKHTLNSTMPNGTPDPLINGKDIVATNHNV